MDPNPINFDQNFNLMHASINFINIDPSGKGHSPHTSGWSWFGASQQHDQLVCRKKLLERYSKRPKRVTILVPTYDAKPCPMMSTFDGRSVSIIETGLVEAGCPLEYLEQMGSPVGLTEQTGHPVKGDVVYICRKNPYQKVRDKLKNGSGIDFSFKSVGNEEWGLEFDGGFYFSPSYSQEKVPDAICTDYAVIIKTRNPDDPDAIALLLMGIRGFGTLGATYLVVRHPEKLCAMFSDKPFACVVRVSWRSGCIDTLTAEVTSHGKVLSD